MVSEEKAGLLALFEEAGRWCQHAEAQDEQGNAVAYDSASAVAWDLTGAMCQLFGWQRAQELFPVVHNHIREQRGQTDGAGAATAIDAMAALQEYNDDQDTTFVVLRRDLESVPVQTA